ncbi:hypothetical protein BT93_I0466 [Corymbia citriodora subsp. variegata]|nr:hypothetical protein BT93_I0466 [Corymbia citriodora subsp. variegata]
MIFGTLYAFQGVDGEEDAVLWFHYILQQWDQLSNRHIKLLEYNKSRELPSLWNTSWNTKAQGLTVLECIFLAQLGFGRFC